MKKVGYAGGGRGWGSPVLYCFTARLLYSSRAAWGNPKSRRAGNRPPIYFLLSTFYPLAQRGSSPSRSPRFPSQPRFPSGFHPRIPAARQCSIESGLLSPFHFLLSRAAPLSFLPLNFLAQRGVIRSPGAPGLGLLAQRDATPDFANGCLTRACGAHRADAA